MIPKNNNFTLTIQNHCVEYLQYLEKANCGVFFKQVDIAIQDYKYGRLKMIKKIMIANPDFTLNSAKKRIPI